MCFLSIKRYKAFKEFSSRILVTTDLFGRGIDIERTLESSAMGRPRVTSCFAQALPPPSVGSLWLLRPRGLTGVNIVINYDFPQESNRDGERASDAYLHRVGRAGRFGTKGLAISFVSSEEDEKALAEVQKRFEMHMPELPDKIDQKDYSTCWAGSCCELWRRQPWARPLTWPVALLVLRDCVPCFAVKTA